MSPGLRGQAYSSLMLCTVYSVLGNQVHLAFSS